MTAKLHQPAVRVDRDVDLGVLRRNRLRRGTSHPFANPGSTLIRSTAWAGSARIWVSRLSRSSKLAVNLFKEEPAHFRQLDPAMQALEQWLADEGFQIADLSADCGLRHE